MDTNITFRIDSDIGNQQSVISWAQMLADANDILDSFAEDYRRMAE